MKMKTEVTALSHDKQYLEQKIKDQLKIFEDLTKVREEATKAAIRAAADQARNDELLKRLGELDSCKLNIARDVIERFQKATKSG